MRSSRNKVKRLFCSGVLLVVSLVTVNVHANVVINGTRVIYSAAENESTLRLNNVSQQPSLVQVWLDAGDAKSTPESGKSPFIATPPIFRVDPTKGQTVRIIYTPDSLPKNELPQNKESVFWINILDVPPMPSTKNTDDANYMQLAIRSRIKLFFRPKELPGSPLEAAEQLHWELVQQGDTVVLRATNGAAFHVSMNEATLTLLNKNYVVNTDMIEPTSTRDFLVRDLKKIPKEPLRLNYSTVNDFGSVIQHNISLSSDTKS